jgi:alkylation response protein AidB-like acyl-CoA dehydrogenase
VSESDFTEFHDELRTVARDLLARGGSGAPLELRVMAAQGWLELEVPEKFGGTGASFAESAVVLEELGRAVTGGDYTGVVLGVGACALLDPAPGRDRLLREIAEGTVIPAVALAATADDCAGAPAFRVRTVGGRHILSGRAEFVPSALQAGWLLLLASDPDGVPLVVLVAADTPGVIRTDQPVLDSTREFGRIVADDVVVGSDSLLRFAGDPAEATRLLHARGSVAIACDSLGLSETMLAQTVAYVGTREQFGRPVGSFQAVKHACADMRVAITVARHLVGAAVTKVAAAQPDSQLAAAMAKSYACGAAVDIAGKAMQLHGGFGYTWESGVHRYLKRATLNRALYGSPSAHRRLVSARYR